MKLNLIDFRNSRIPRLRFERYNMFKLRVSVFSSLLALVCLGQSVFGQAGLQRKNHQQSLKELRNSYAPVSDKHFMATWVSRGFSITKGGSWINWSEGSNPKKKFNWFWFSYFQNKPGAGFDVGVGKITASKRVSDLSTNIEAWQAPGYNRTLDFTFVDNLNPTTAGSFWWMGPKTIIYSLPNWLDKDVPDQDRLDGEYECYIVNNSSDTRQKLVKRLGLKFRRSVKYNGDRYYHYTVKHVFTGSDGKPRTINQIWTIKGVFTNEDSVPVNQIQGDWMTNGLVPWNYYNLGWKMNLETSGKFADGYGMFVDLALPAND